MTTEELEIIEFYRQGYSIPLISECYGHSLYRIKKLLADEPTMRPIGYIHRGLYEKIPDCQVK